LKYKVVLLEDGFQYGDNLFVVSALFSCLRISYVVLSVSCIGMFTYKSFMMYVIILWCLFIVSFVRLSASSIEFFTLYWLLRCRCLFIISTRRFANLYDGAFVLLMAGLMGLPGLCSFIWAFRFGG
jgi:hypothetical protein